MKCVGYKKQRIYLFVSVIVALFVDNDNGTDVRDDLEDDDDDDDDDDDEDEDVMMMRTTMMEYQKIRDVETYQ